MAAVRVAGSPTVSSGSTRATRAAIRGLPTLILNDLAVSVTTDQNVTSLPVPAVVGMAMSGVMGLRHEPKPS